MPCYKPLRAWRVKTGRNKNGLWPVTFTLSEGYKDLPVELPCGQCIGCRLERSRQWAIRCLHEAKMHKQNCFLTLTYDNNHINTERSLQKRDFQLFMKRLRKHAGKKIRFFHCGEYGESLQRPHYHACIFGYDFPDKKLWNIKNGVKIYVSEKLSRLWSYGYSTIGQVNFESAAYVARYCTKKVTGEKAEQHYGNRQPEYVTMSNRPGIGKTFYEKFKTDIYNHDKVVIRNKLICRPPKYYDKVYDVDNHEQLEQYKRERRRKADKRENEFDRLEIREKVQINKSEKLKRSYESGTKI